MTFYELTKDGIALDDEKRKSIAAFFFGSMNCDDVIIYGGPDYTDPNHLADVIDEDSMVLLIRKPFDTRNFAFTRGTEEFRDWLRASRASSYDAFEEYMR